jgi:hypothetical protein
MTTVMTRHNDPSVDHNESEPALRATMDLHELRHEVSNALAVASGQAQHLLRRLPADANTREREALLAIRASVERAVRLLDSAVASTDIGSDLRLLVARARLHVPPERADDVNVEVQAAGPLTGV